MVRSTFQVTLNCMRRDTRLIRWKLYITAHYNKLTARLDPLFELVLLLLVTSMVSIWCRTR